MLVNVSVPVNEFVLSLFVFATPWRACTFNLFVVIVEIFVDSAVNALIVLPALGLLIAVMLELWCEAILLILLSSVVHCVAVIVVLVVTLLTVELSPYPESPDPVPQIAFTEVAKSL